MILIKWHSGKTATMETVKHQLYINHVFIFCFYATLTSWGLCSQEGIERVTGRKARGPQVAGGNKLMWVFFFFPSLLMKPVLPKANLFFLFSNFGLGMALQTSIHVRCFLVGVGRGGKGMTPLGKSYLKSAYCGRGAWWSFLSLDVFLSSD